MVSIDSILSNSTPFVTHYLGNPEFIEEPKAEDFETGDFSTFELAYSKDESSSAGSDTAWIDDIVFPVGTDNSPAQASKH